MSYEKAPVLKLESELQAAIEAKCDVAYAVTASPLTAFYLQQLPIMWAGLNAGVPVVNGYSGSTPAGIPSTIERSANFPAVLQWLDGKVQGRLCWVQSNRSNQLPPNIPLKSINADLRYQSEHFTTFVIPLPPNVPLKEFSQSIEAKVPRLMRSHQIMKVPLFVQNTSRYTWFQTEEAPINLSYRWLKLDGTIVVDNGQRTPIPASIVPGETIALNAIVEPPAPGQYQLSLTLVQENVGWFADRGAKPFNAEVKIIP
jgi:hypothetical protein